MNCMEELFETYISGGAELFDTDCPAGARDDLLERLSVVGQSEGRICYTDQLEAGTGFIYSRLCGEFRADFMDY